MLRWLEGDRQGSNDKDDAGMHHNRNTLHAPQIFELGEQHGEGNSDAFVTKFSASGQALFSTYFGGNNNDQGYAIAADNAGNAYVTGYTGSSNFPILHPFQAKLAGQLNAFVAKIST